MGFVLNALFAIDGIGVCCLNRRSERRLERNLDLSIQCLKTLQHRRLKNLLMCLCRHVAEGQENRVAGVIVLGIEVPQLLIGEVGYVLRVAAAIKVIGVRRKQLVTESIPQNRGRGGHRALHFIEHHALKYQRLAAVVVLELNPVPLLREIEGVQSREKHRVQIHIQQVAEILSVLRGEGVGRPVRAGEGVHERVQRSAQHHEKRIAHGIPLAATQCGVLKDMGHTGGVLGHGAQGHHEHILRRVAAQVQMLCPGGGVLVLLDSEIQAGNGHRSLQNKRVGGLGRCGAARGFCHVGFQFCSVCLVSG